MHEPLGRALAILAGEEVVAAELLVGDPVLEHVVGADKDRVGDSDDRLLVSAAATYPQVLGAQARVFRAPGGAVGGLDQSNPQPAVALAVRRWTPPPARSLAC